MVLQFHNTDRPVYFLHIPKAAGTSFRVLLENAFHIDEICPAYDFFSLTRIPEEQLARYRLFRGHLGYNLIHYLPDRPFTLTLLRDPVERAISHFEYIRRDPGHPLYQRINKGNLDLRGFVNDPELRWEIENRQIRMLGQNLPGNVLRRLARESGTPADFQKAFNAARGQEDPEKTLERATNRLGAMEFVGLTERFADSVRLAACQLGLRAPADLPALNTGISGRPTLSAETRELIEATTALETALYRHAASIFQERWRLLDIALPKQRFLETYRLHHPPCTALTWDFREPLSGSGWMQRELEPGRGFRRWTGPGRESLLDLPLAPGQNYRLKLQIVDRMDPNQLHELALSLNDRPLELHWADCESPWECSTVIPATALHVTGPQVLKIRIGNTIRKPAPHAEGIQHNTNRNLGIAISGIRAHRLHD